MKKEFYWTNIIGLCRSILALGTLLTLLLNPVDVLFNQEILNQEPTFFQQYGLFFILKDAVFLAKTLVIIVLLLVISGTHPRITGVLHWYVTWSFFTSCNIIDGGDHIASVLTLLLIPITLTDSRKNHWKEIKHSIDTYSSTIANAFLFLIKVQVCAIYLHAFVGKVPVAEWLNGTATYYWLTHEYFGIHQLLRPVFNFFLSNNVIVAIVTWGVLLIEFLLSACIMLDQKSSKRKVMLMIGVLFHLSIFIVHGLATFFLSISAGLILYLVNNQYYLDYEHLINLIKTNKHGKRFYRIINI